MAGSIERVTEAARLAGLEIEVKRMGASTRTSEEAAVQCGCGVAQIMKSLEPIEAFAEAALLDHAIVWAAAGAHDAVFSADPRKLLEAARARIADIAE